LLTVARTPGLSRGEHEEVGPDHARLWLAGGGVAELDRADGHVRMGLPPDTSDAALVHPFLAPVAVVTARWLGRESFHGGGFVAAGGAWGVLGEKTAGKSTTLAALALAGVPVVSDDVLVLEGTTVFAGPRSVDLRPEAAAHLGAGESLGTIGTRERWRLHLPRVEPELPLRGWVSLDWGDEVTVEPLKGADRFSALVEHRGARIEPLAPSQLIALTSLPHVRFVRPRSWAALPNALERLLAALADV
jgi:hypothetical protein